jgi:hypothetical protein
MLNFFRSSITVTERALSNLIGLLFVALGLLLAVRFNLGSSQVFHWWALFIILPALLFFAAAWGAARRRFSGRLALALLGLGLIVLTVAGIFLLNLNWAQWWPLMLITPGLTLIGAGLPNLAPSPKPAFVAWVSLLAWVGLAICLLGLIFLAGNFQWIDLQRLAQGWGWWSAILLLCALGAAFNAIWLWRRSGKFSLAVLGIVLLTNTLLIAAIYEWIQAPRRIEQLPWLLITTGIWVGIYFVIRK